CAIMGNLERKPSRKPERYRSFSPSADLRIGMRTISLGRFEMGWAKDPAAVENVAMSRSSQHHRKHSPLLYLSMTPTLRAGHVSYLYASGMLHHVRPPNHLVALPGAFLCAMA